MSTGALTPIPRWQISVDGVPAAGAKLYTYSSGTSTPLSVYSQPTIDPAYARTNPVVADADGVFPVIYLAPVAYRFLVTDADGVTIYPAQDNIYDFGQVYGGGSEVDIVAGETIAAQSAVYMSDGSGGNVAGRWYKADADFGYASNSASLVGISQNSSLSAGDSGRATIAGRITGLVGLVAGTDYYVSATAGALTSTAPSNARYVGTADSTTSLVIAPNPSRVRGTAGGVVYGTGSTTQPLVTAAGTTGQVLLSAGSSAPTWGGQTYTLLKANSGTSTAAGATNVDTVSVPALTANDTLIVYVNLKSVSQATATVTLYTVTDSGRIVDVSSNPLASGTSSLMTATVRQQQSGATAIIGYSTGYGGSGVVDDINTLTMTWQSAWTLALRHGGVTAGGTLQWTWAVYRVLGQ